MAIVSLIKAQFSGSGQSDCEYETNATKHQLHTREFTELCRSHKSETLVRSQPEPLSRFSRKESKLLGLVVQWKSAEISMMDAKDKNNRENYLPNIDTF